MADSGRFSYIKFTADLPNKVEYFLADRTQHHLQSKVAAATEVL